MVKKNKYIIVSVALPVYKKYTYQLPDHLVDFFEIGKRVLVPFRKRRVTGYIIGIAYDLRYIDISLNVIDILDEKPLFPEEMISFFEWIADYYIYPLGEVIKNALPSSINLYDASFLYITEKGLNCLLKDLVNSSEKEILCYIKEKPCSKKSICKRLNKGISESLFQTMIKKGIISVKRKFHKIKITYAKERFIKLKPFKKLPDRFTEKRKEIIDYLGKFDEISILDLRKKFPKVSGFLKPLKENGLISIYYKKIYRDPFGDSILQDETKDLTDEQESVVQQVIDSLGKGFKAYLLEGVTGSGKTEVYMTIAAEAIKRGMNVLILVPEIALISQTAGCFRARFGECIAILHSGLSKGEKIDQWHRILEKGVSITIGVRSSIFAPFDKLGLIIVDEEHDASYKQDSALRYNARDLAVVRANLNNCLVLLGSATPSVQSFYNVLIKKYSKLSLKYRINKKSLPEIKIVDLREYRDIKGIKRFITPKLYEAIKDCLEKKEQVLLFLNRRGFATFPVCCNCGETIKCTNCDISMTFHKKINAYKCHFCGFSMASISNCPCCGSQEIKQLGLGTEKIEESIRKLFPSANIARLDYDTTKRKVSIIQILKKVKERVTDILIGTQMIAKGHDFPNITLVGVICADLSLSFPDFRATERTFQLLAQVAGRAGRGELKGQVIMQTYNPEHFSIISAKSHNFEDFFKQEIQFRDSLKYPPFSRLIQLKISGKEEKKTEFYARIIGEWCMELIKGHKKFKSFIHVLGPIEAPIPRIAKNYRWQILLKSNNTIKLHELAYMLLFENLPKLKPHKIRVVIDVDPYFMM